ENLSIGLCSRNLLSPHETSKAFLPPPIENPGEHGAAGPEAPWCERSPEEGRGIRNVSMAGEKEDIWLHEVANGEPSSKCSSSTDLAAAFPQSPTWVFLPTHVEERTETAASPSLPCCMQLCLVRSPSSPPPLEAIEAELSKPPRATQRASSHSAFACSLSH
ncbi:hypothetical protein GW17_00039074, partial [Ensete ventricosum]